jgi:hypothetical protein
LEAVKQNAGIDIGSHSHWVATGQFVEEFKGLEFTAKIKKPYMSG